MRVMSVAVMVAGLCFSSVNYAQQRWHHQGAPAQLIELFTSEGCSSCPAADTYLSSLKGSDGLWSEVIPIAFHVDYWNYLGWKDRFSHPSFTQRQRLYRTYGRSGSVYTPGFFVDGKEWQGYFSRTALPKQTTIEGNSLSLILKNTSFSLTYNSNNSYLAHIVLLAMDEYTQIRAGENEGKELKHDFIVLEKRQKVGRTNWYFDWDKLPSNADAVVVWLTETDGFTPVQTVAGYIEQNSVD